MTAIRAEYTAIVEYDAEDHPDMTPERARENLLDLIGRDPNFGEVDVRFVE